MLIIQVFGVLFCVLFLYVNFINYKKEVITTKFFGFWSFVWLGGMIWVLVGNKLTKLISFFQINTVFDMSLMMGVIICVGVVYWNNTQIIKQNSKIELLVRRTAYNEIKKEMS